VDRKKGVSACRKEKQCPHRPKRSLNMREKRYMREGGWGGRSRGERKGNCPGKGEKKEKGQGEGEGAGKKGRGAKKRKKKKSPYKSNGKRAVGSPITKRFARLGGLSCGGPGKVLEGERRSNR